MSYLIKKIKLIFKHKRDQVYLKNFILIFILQGLSSFAALFIIPLALGYLDQERYGIWLVVSSIFSWIGFFNLGLGAGLRLKLTESLALKNFDLSRRYVSTTYYLVSATGIVIIIIFFICNLFLDWTSILNANTAFRKDIEHTVIICAIAFAIRFVFSLMLTILEADQKIGLIKIFPFSTNLSIIMILLFVRSNTESSLSTFTMAMVVPEIAVFIILNFFFFQKKYKSISPSLKQIQMSLGKDLISVGLKFFVIQISIIILFSTNNIILARLFNPSTVTSYNISMQYIGFASTVFYLILSPLPAAFNEAIAHNDMHWIIGSIKKLVKIWLIFTFLLAVMVIASPYIFQIWIGKDFFIPISMTALMAIFAATTYCNNIFGIFLLATGKINIVTIICIIIIIINIPLSIYFARDLGLGPNGVILASIICLLLGSISNSIQTYLLIIGKARGIWNK